MTTISQNGGTIYFRLNGADIEYSKMTETNWVIVSRAQFPITIINSNLMPLSTLLAAIFASMLLTKGYLT